MHGVMFIRLRCLFIDRPICASLSWVVRDGVVSGEERRESIQGWWRVFEHAPLPRFATMHVTWQVRESSAGTIRQHIMQCD